MKPRLLFIVGVWGLMIVSFDSATSDLGMLIQAAAIVASANLIWIALIKEFRQEEK